jgi:uncharacterized protein (DUF2147 family)
MVNCKFFLTGLLSIALMCQPARGMDFSPVGLWKTIDDNTHKPRGLIRLYEDHGEIYGKVEASFDPKEAGERCDKCDGERKDKPVVGMVVIRHMVRHGREYSGGDILDPDTGWVYRCRFTLEDGGKKLVVRGYLGLSLLGRSQTWYRADERKTE